MKRSITLFALALCIACVLGDPGGDADPADPGLEPMSTTVASTPFADNKVDLSEAEINEAVNVDVGIPEQFHYQYHHDQFDKGGQPDYNDTCIGEYIHCLSGLAGSMPVCAFHDHNRHYGYYNTMTYCGVYFDNCRREIRVWRILDYGECRLYHGTHADDVYHTRRTYPLIYKLLNMLSKQSHNTRFPVSELPRQKLHLETTTEQMRIKENDWMMHEAPHALGRENHKLIFDLPQYNSKLLNNLMRYPAYDRISNEIW